MYVIALSNFQFSNPFTVPSISQMIDYIKDLAAVCIIKHETKFTVSVTFCISSSSFMASSVGAMTWLSVSQHRLKRMLSGVVSSCCLVDYAVVDYTGYEISWLLVGTRKPIILGKLDGIYGYLVQAFLSVELSSWVRSVQQLSPTSMSWTQQIEKV